MAERRSRQEILPSLLDRLTDEEPRNRSEGEVSRGQALRDLKASLRRDIEWLLNTRRRITEIPTGSVQLPESLFNYGLPDLTGFALNTERDQAELVSLIEQVIATFEPRLRTVIVSMQPITAAARIIRFQIEGILRVEPGPERIQFDTLLELTSGTYKVEGGPVRSDLLNYYERELAYVRQLGAEFASKYPKVASRLLLEPNRCEDPHVERLIEAFSFLAARLHLKLDDEFPELTQALLGILFPHYIRPLPSMTVAEFSLDVERSGLTTRTVLPRGSALFSRSTGGVRLQFRTGFDLELWPIRVAAAQWVTPERLAQPIRTADAPGALRVELACGHGASFAALPINSLRFFLNAEASIVYPLYEMLAGRCLRIIARDLNPRSQKSPVVLPASCLQPCGFAQDESLIPYPRRSFDGYRLLQEYFAFPEKFLFLELKGLEVLREAGFGENIELVFLCGDCERPDWLPMLQLGVSERTLRLGCCTLVNLFPHTADPVTLDGTRFEYPVVPDARRPDSYEVFSIESVVGTNPVTSEVLNFDPFYSVRHSPSGRQGELFWHATRRDSSVRMDDNTDLWLSTVDLAGQPRRPEIDTLTVRCLCTNRELPSRMPFGEEGGDFELDVASTVTRVIALRKPTPTIRPSLGGAVLWRLLSQLSLNYLSLIEEGRDALQEILRLYTPPAGFGERQVEGIATLTSRRHFARVMGDYGISFVRGMKVQVELDEECFVGASAYLFSSVLDRFLGLYVNMNGFSQLEVWSRQRKEILKQWPARSGYGILL